MGFFHRIMFVMNWSELPGMNQTIQASNASRADELFIKLRIACHLFTRIGLCDNLAHAMLIEAFVSIVAFEILKMRTNRAALHSEPVRLRGSDQALIDQPADAAIVHRPALALGECLRQE